MCLRWDMLHPWMLAEDNVCTFVPVSNMHGYRNITRVVTANHLINNVGMRPAP